MIVPTPSISASRSLNQIREPTSPRVTLVLRIAGSTVYPYAFDGRVLSILDARYVAVLTGPALAAAARYVLRIRGETGAASVTIVVLPQYGRRYTAPLVHEIHSTLRRNGIAVETTPSDDLMFTTPLSLVIDRRLAWELITILQRRR